MRLLRDSCLHGNVHSMTGASKIDKGAQVKYAAGTYVFQEHVPVAGQVRERVATVVVL